MTRRDVEHWLGQHWGKVLLAAAFTVGLWVARAEAKFASLAEMETDHAIVQGLGRLICQGSRTQAQTAGIPCGRLLYEWEPWRGDR